MSAETKSELYGPSLAATRHYAPGDLFLHDTPALVVPYLADGTLCDQLHLVWRAVLEAEGSVRAVIDAMHVPNEVRGYCLMQLALTHHAHTGRSAGQDESRYRRKRFRVSCSSCK